MTALTADELHAFRAANLKAGHDSQRETYAARRAALAEDVEELLDDRRPADEIARRLNRSVAAIERSLYRVGRPDLARPFGHEIRRRRKEFAS